MSADRDTLRHTADAMVVSAVKSIGEETGVAVAVFIMLPTGEVMSNTMITYASNIERADAVRVLRRWADAVEAGAGGPGEPVGHRGSA